MYVYILCVFPENSENSKHTLTVKLRLLVLCLFTSSVPANSLLIVDFSETFWVHP